MIRQAEDRLGVGRAVGDDAVKAGRSFEGMNSNQVLIRPDGDDGFLAAIQAVSRRGESESRNRRWSCLQNVTAMTS